MPSMMSYAPPSQPTPKDEDAGGAQKTMSVPPPAPGGPGAPVVGYVSPAQERMYAGEPELLAARKKRPVAPASRFIPFWLTVLILAALIALIAWWLAS